MKFRFLATVLLTLASLSIFGINSVAQTTPAPAPSPSASSFSVGAQIVGLSGSSPVAATVAGGRFAVTNNLEIGTDNYIAPAYHADFGTVSYQLTFLSKQLDKTNLTGNNFRFGIKGGLGMVFPNGANQRVSGLAGGWFQYAPAGNKQFALEGGADWISAQPHNLAVRFGPVLTF